MDLWKKFKRIAIKMCEHLNFVVLMKKTDTIVIVYCRARLTKVI